MSKKTREDVERLKAGWLADPCFNLAGTEGFEAFKEELQRFEINQQKEWERKAREEKLWIGRRWGFKFVSGGATVTDPLEFGEQMLVLLRRVDELEEKVKGLESKVYNY